MPALVFLHGRWKRRPLIRISKHPPLMGEVGTTRNRGLGGGDICNIFSKSCVYTIKWN